MSVGMIMSRMLSQLASRFALRAVAAAVLVQQLVQLATFASPAAAFSPTMTMVRLWLACRFIRVVLCFLEWSGVANGQSC